MLFTFALAFIFIKTTFSPSIAPTKITDIIYFLLLIFYCSSAKSIGILFLSASGLRSRTVLRIKLKCLLWQVLYRYRKYILKCCYCCFTGRESCHRVYSRSVTSTTVRHYDLKIILLSSYSHLLHTELLKPVVASAQLLNHSCSKYFRCGSHEAASHVSGSRAMLMQQQLNKFELLDLEETSQQGLLKQMSP